MSPEEAYCCLHCTGDGSCCKECGECEGCCQDCKDLSRCSNKAYFNGDFFLKYDYDANYSSSYTESGTDDVDCYYKQSLGLSTTLKFTKIYGKDFLCDGNIISVSSGTCCDEECCPPEGISSNIYTKIEKNSFETINESSPAYDYGPTCGEKITTKSFGHYSSNIATIDGDFCECSPESCVDYEFEKSYPWGLWKGHGTAKASGSINFYEGVRLYNSKGEVVDPTEAYTNADYIIPTYNPCDPTRLWGPPPCHFFAP